LVSNASLWAYLSELLTCIVSSYGLLSGHTCTIYTVELSCGSVKWETSTRTQASEDRVLLALGKEENTVNEL